MELYNQAVELMSQVPDHYMQGVQEWKTEIRAV